MAPKGEQAAGRELKELLATETSVLRALCLTINATGSVVKDRILETLFENVFFFPITKAVFAALSEMHQRGDYVVGSNLEDELRNREVGIPEGFYLEDLFHGDPPKLPELTGWLSRLKDRAGKGHPSPPGGVAEAQPAAPGTSRAPAAAPTKTEIVSASTGRTGGPELEKPSKVRQARSETAGGKPRQGAPFLISSEGEEWANYLQELAAKQGKIFETGFAGLDETAGGLSPSLMMVVDQDVGRLSGFLKQLTDQVAARSGLPCLYLSFDLPKTTLRVRTLGRLSGVSARDIEKGRIKKGSPEWESVERSGREAAEWLKWVFVVDADPEMGFDGLRDMGRQLLESYAASTCLVVVDRLEKMEHGEFPQSMVAGLKELSESLEALVIAATTDKALASEPGVDFLATLGESKGTAVQLEILRVEDSHSTVIQFEYRPDIYRFIEQPGS
jgi:hypothetical protein